MDEIPPRKADITWMYMVALIVGAFGLAACGGIAFMASRGQAQPTPTVLAAEVTAEVTAESTLEVTAEVTEIFQSATPSITPTPTVTATPTDGPSPTVTPSATVTPTPQASAPRRCQSGGPKIQES